MTKPAQARTAPGGSRVYRWPPQPPHEFEAISVTAALGNGYPKPALVGWAAKRTAEVAVDDHDLIGQMLKKEDGEQAAIDHLKGARFRDAKKKANRGTIVHAAVEAYLADKPLSAEDIEAQLAEARVPRSMWKAAQKMIGAAYQFLDDVEPIVWFSEATVYSRAYGYAGTADLIVDMHIGGTLRPVVIDFKTSPRIYDETGLQLCAYARADFVGLNDGTEERLTAHGISIQDGVAVCLKPSGKYEAVVFALTDDLFDVFLAARTIAVGQNVVATARRPGF